MGGELVERLARADCQVNVTVEREVGSTRVANSAGADAKYRSTGVGVSAEVWRIAGDDVLAIGDAYEGADLPTADALTALVRSIQARLDRALKLVPPPEGSLPVVFTPAGLAALFPSRKDCQGRRCCKESPRSPDASVSGCSMRRSASPTIRCMPAAPRHVRSTTSACLPA
jgi:hypothetical protein